MIDQEGFEGWVAFVDATIQQLFDELGSDVARRLDFTCESLDVLEEWLLNKYESVDEILQPSENWYLDRVAKYVGETIRRTVGGEWGIELGNPSYAYYGLPEIRTSKGETECPVTLVTASLDRRRGNYIRNIVESMI